MNKDILKRANETVKGSVLHLLSCSRAQKDAIAKADFYGQAVGGIRIYNLFVLQASFSDAEKTALLLNIDELSAEVNAKFEKAKQ